MIERSTGMRTQKYGVVAAAAAALASGILVASPASADYGPGAVYQVELTANVAGPDGGGVWLWYALNSDGTGDYHGSDCGHGEGAAADAGDVTWHRVGDQIEIDGTVLAGLGDYQATVTVPATYGHYTGTLGTYISLPAFIPSGIGFSQLQVAP
jgi:hypothetical protein